MWVWVKIKPPGCHFGYLLEMPKKKQLAPCAKRSASESRPRLKGSPQVKTVPQTEDNLSSMHPLTWLTLEGQQQNQILAGKWGFPTKPQQAKMKNGLRKPPMERRKHRGTPNGQLECFGLKLYLCPTGDDSGSFSQVP